MVPKSHIYRKKNLGESSNGKRKKRIFSSESHGSTSDDDKEGIEMHLTELVKEAKKKRATQDIDKIVRLQSITTTFRLRKIEVSFCHPCTTSN